LLEHFENLARRRLPGELTRAPNRAFSEGSTKVFTGKDPIYCGSEFFDLMRVNREAGITNQFFEGIAGAHDDGPAAGHRFDRRQSEAFIQGRHHECRARIVQPAELLIGNKAREHHLMPNIQLGHQGFELGVVSLKPIRSVVTGKH
jgi:hypothetical protein